MKERSSATRRSWTIAVISGQWALCRHPIAIARSILESSKAQNPLGRVHPLLLVSTGAFAFAQRNIPDQAEAFASLESLVSERAKAEWKHWRRVLELAKDTTPNPEDAETERQPMEDTVGAIALRQDPSSVVTMAAGVSS